MRLVIVGGGPAALEAAVAARNGDGEAEIVLLSREAELPYRRPALSRMVMHDLPENQFLIRPETFYREKRIAVKTNAEVIRFDRGARLLTLRDGSGETYDRLLLATGADCRTLPVPGADLPGVLGYRSYADVLALRQRIENGARRIAIIGGGLLGLELADALLSAGCEVTILERQPRLLPRQLDEDGSSILEKNLGQVARLRILTGVGAERIEGSRQVESLVLDDGRRPACDCVVMAPGTVPCCGLARDAGLPVGRGIKVDRRLQTGDPAVWAAGDCAEVEGCGLTGLFAQAAAAGKIAGANMTGNTLEYHPPVGAARLNALGVKLFSAGVAEGGEVKTAQGADGSWKRLFLNDGIAVGGILFGDLKSALRWSDAIASGQPVPPEILAEFPA